MADSSIPCPLTNQQPNRSGLETVIERALLLPPARLALFARRVARLRVRMPELAGIARLDDALAEALELMTQTDDARLLKSVARLRSAKRKVIG